LDVFAFLSFLAALVSLLGSIFALGGVLLFAGLILIAIRFVGQRTGCPSCQGWFVKHQVERRMLDTKITTQARPSINSPAGDLFGKGHQVPMVYEEYQTNYVCRKCGYEWSRVDTRSHMQSNTFTSVGS
jgi:C4-type Zn-finger protein